MFVNGGAILGCFSPNNPKVFDGEVRNHFQGGNVFITFLNSPSVKLSLPELDIESPSVELMALRSTVPLVMEGELTHLLLSGGAYKRFDGSVDDARTISRNLMTAMIDNRCLTPLVASSSAPWTKWFHGIAWDYTYIVIDHEVPLIWLLCLTDTD
jgi:hypothetical protein